MKIYGIVEIMYGYKLENDGDWDYVGVTMGGDCLHHVGFDKLEHEEVNKVIGSSFDECFDEEDESDQLCDVLDYLYDRGLCDEDHVVYCKILHKLLYNVFSVQEEAEAFVQKNGDRELSVVELKPEGSLAEM